MNIKTKEELKKTWKDYKFIIYAYIVFLIIYLLLFCTLRENTENFLDEQFECGFGVSLSSSLLGGLITFGILGFIAIVVPTRLSTKKPEEEPFENRVRSLMNGDNVKDNDETLEFLKSYLERHLVFNQNMKVRYTIKRYNADPSALEILTESTYYLTNMCKDKNFKPREINIFVSPDTPINGEFGYISYLATSDKVEIQNYIIKIDENGFRRLLKIAMPKNAKKEVSVSYCIWSTMDNDLTNEKAWFFTEVERYTQHAVFEIVNELDMDLTFSQAKFNNLKQERTIQANKFVLLSHQTISIPPQELFPDERFQILFYKSKGEEV